MTTIVGIEDGDVAWIGGDSMALSGHRAYIEVGGGKVFRVGEMAFGCSSSMRAAQILRHHLVLPERDEAMRDIDYLVRALVPAIRRCFEDNGHRPIASDDEDKNSWATQAVILIGYRGAVYKIWGDYEIARPDEGIDAAGNGEEVAKGYLYAHLYVLTGSVSTSGKEMALGALRAAEHFTNATRGPFTVLCSPKEWSPLTETMDHNPWNVPAEGTLK